MKKILLSPLALTLYTIITFCLSLFFTIKFSYKYGGSLHQENEISALHYEKTLSLKNEFSDSIEGQEIIRSSFEDQIITYREYNKIRKTFKILEDQAKIDRLKYVKFQLNS